MKKADGTEDTNKEQSKKPAATVQQRHIVTPGYGAPTLGPPSPKPPFGMPRTPMARNIRPPQQPVLPKKEDPETKA